MHEMSYIVRLVDIALKTAEDRHLSSVRKIVVKAGRMTGVVPYYMQKYYKAAIRGTLLEGSDIEVIPIEVEAVCGGCGTEYSPDAAHDYLCPVCGGGNCRITAGRSVVLDSMEGETNNG